MNDQKQQDTMIVKAMVAAVIIISMIGMLSYPATNIKAQLRPSQLPAQEPPRATQLPAPAQEPPRATQLPVLPQAQENKHLPVETTQDDHVIITTVTKTNKPIEGPIVILPPTHEGGNSTIVEPGQNVTNNNNETIVIEPDGNVTQIPNGNVTQPDNGTIIITEPGRNVTETPGNVTVIDPPRPTQLPTIPPQNNSNTTPNQCSCNNNTINNKLPTNTTMPPPFQPQQQPNVNQTNDQGSTQKANTLLGSGLRLNVQPIKTVLTTDRLTN